LKIGSIVFNLDIFSFYFSAKLIPVGYGIKKLQINCVIEDDKVSTDDLEEKIVGFEDLVSLFNSLNTTNYNCSPLITVLNQASLHICVSWPISILLVAQRST
jgi:hypothetical protein